MGIPKFYRWLGERYPSISQLISDSHIPEFDCLYLDMNGIIHNCTHKDSDSPTFRMTEDKMFIAIFNYIEHLFSKIKPKKLFFMAIDGVAPRAKMNQQRARRFRTALDAELAREKAIKEGVEMPKEAPFDSNCITPGTEFMARLSQHLKYFINKKISEDVDWQGVDIVLSGHEVPGEGEHKIMEYIRQAKAQKQYDPNLRHCMYGLDADLIMLGLLSHDPHFCLLREEVTFGRASKSKSKELEHQNFFLMHLCIVREYLELEFQELKAPGALTFPFDMERVIDDFILMAFFVGNDFLPNLPHLHINEGALSLMFETYKSALPKAKGYINEGGVIRLDRLALLLNELSHAEYRFFEHENQDASWLQGKQGREDVMTRQKRRGIPQSMSTAQHKLFQQVESYVQNRPSSGGAEPLDLGSSLKASDRKFVEDLASTLRLEMTTVEDDAGNRSVKIAFPPKLSDSDDDAEDDQESQFALSRVLKQFRKLQIVDVTAEEAQFSMERKYQQKFDEWKNKYYHDKFGWDLSDKTELTKLAQVYVRGLQWVLYYYYKGVASWPWFYNYHFSPMISDIKLGLEADLTFELGQPFLPYQQLMGVLPDRSKSIVPTAYWPLMTDPKSPIIDFYPRDFELDMNGKKQDWEAVVKIPFIEEKRLLSAMATVEQNLTPGEASRNGFGVTLKFTYTPDRDFTYPTSLVGYFPDITNCHCTENIYDLPTMDGLEVYVGLVEGVKLGVQALAGFPTLKTLPFAAQAGFHGVNVFQQDSKNESMIVTLLDSATKAKISAAQARLGKAIHIGYPFLQEAKVIRVSDEMFDYALDAQGHVSTIPHEGRQIEDWRKAADRIEKNYSKKLGIIIGEVDSLVHVEMLKGLSKRDDGSTVKEYGEVPGQETNYATQTIVDEVFSADPRYLEEAAKPIEEEFPLGSRAFFLGDFAYGRPVMVTGHANGKLHVSVLTLKIKEREFGREVAQHSQRMTRYTPSYAIARNLQLHPLALSKITSALSVESNGLRLNLGLNLKFEAKKMKVLGYSRKSETGWEFSDKAVQLLQQYMIKFPEFIAGISMRPKGDIYHDTDFYPDKDIAKAKVKEIGSWLKSIQTKSFDAVPLEAEQLDSDAVDMIQQAAAATIAQQHDQTVAKDMKGVPRHALLNPVDADKRTGDQNFQVGDRVVYVLSSGKVPIAQRGTVVGITRTARQTWLDCVFDQSFMSGTNLGDRCQPFFGATVPSNSVLNLTMRQVLAESQAARSRKPPPQSAQNNGARSYGVPMGPNGLGQSMPAVAPAPLQHSWRGIASGQDATANGRGNFAPTRSRGRGGLGSQPTHSNGHASQQQTNQPQQSHNKQRQENNTPSDGFQVVRGRGSRGRAARGGQSNGLAHNTKGYTVVDNVDEGEGVHSNPNFRPTQSYNNMAPPTSLDTSRGGRGGRPRGDRGSARNRGRGGRGRGQAAADQQQPQVQAR